MKKVLKHKELQMLRQKAEELLLKKSSETNPKITEIEIIKLIHELEVHQIELELQNDELRHSWAIAEAAQEKYSNLYDFAPSGYFTLSKLGDIVEMNLTASKFFGTERSKMMQKRFTLFLSHDSIPVFIMFLDKVFQSNIEENCEVTLVTNGGKPTIILLTGTITGNHENCNVSIVDITERRQLEDILLAEQSFRRSIEVSLASGIAIADKNGRQIYVNPSFCRLLGWSEAELTGKTAPYVYWPPEHFQAIENAFKLTLEDNAPEEGFELVFMRKDGSLIPVMVVISPFTNGKELVGWLANVTDITLRKQAESEIQLLYKSLERRVVERTTQLETANSELTFHLNEVEQFTYIASHDLQEPLRTLINYTNLIREEFGGKLGEDGDKYIGFIAGSAYRMRSLVTALLDYALLGKESQLTMVDCNKIMEEVLSDMADTIAKCHAAISFGELPHINGYETELRLLFQNLIDNAIKFHKKDICPEVKISYKNLPKEWLFSIEDNGVGIKEKDKMKIFIIFRRMQNRNDFDGIGIGLAHCKKIAEMHGGRIWVESEPGTGSTFFFTIPKR